MDKNTIVKIANREDGYVGYSIPELMINRQFAPRETKEITFGELEQLSFVDGGMVLLSEFLVIKDPEAASAILPNVEPEYYYTEADIKRLLTEGSIDELLDCLDFAPDGVLDILKEVAVALPLDNYSKRKVILDKIGFNVTKAIEIRNTKFDGDDAVEPEKTRPTRRVSKPETPTEGRRTTVPNYNVIK